MFAALTATATASIIFPVDSRIRSEIKKIITDELQQRCPRTFKEQNFFAVKIDAELDEDNSFYVVSLVGINPAGDIVNNVKIGIEEWADGYDVSEFGAANCH